MLFELSHKDKGSCAKLLDTIDIYGQTALHWAAGNGNLEITKKLLEEMTIETIFKQAGGNRQYTALHLGLHSNNIKIISEILAKISQENKSKLVKILYMVDTDGQTALHWAAGACNLETVKKVLEPMTLESVEAKTSNNLTALDLAASDDIKDLILTRIQELKHEKEVTHQEYSSPYVLREEENIEFSGVSNIWVDSTP